jgi:hypothetical protein
MNIVVAGIIGRYPYGGVAWCSLMYLLGLQKLGHRVWYLEDTGEANFDPVQNTMATEPDYALRFIDETLRPFGFGECWCYVDHTGNYYGHSAEQWKEICRSADAFLNLSGGSWFWREEYAAIPLKAFIDTDPAFTQLSIAKGEEWYLDFFRGFDCLFTFGSNIGTPRSDVPVGDFHWMHTWQPVVMDEWTPPAGDVRDVFTTVMSWRIHSFSDIGGNKDVEFMKILDLPSASPDNRIELAVSGPSSFLEQHGWKCRDAFEVSSDIHRYRDYIRSSYGEFSIAKNTYVRTNSGWFSDRTECYMASGRPAVVQDTGFSTTLPTGQGLLTFQTMEEALDGLAAVRSDQRRHGRIAREIAAAHFASEVVLTRLLDRMAGTSSESGEVPIQRGVTS